MIPALARATKSVLAHLGEDAFLRGSVTPTKIHVERDVQMVDREGNVYVAQTVFTIDNDDTPAPGDAVTLAGVGYVLDTMVDTNGYSTRFIARKT